MAQTNRDQLDTFLERTRQGILLTVNDDGTAGGVPVWFDWDGEEVRFFTSRGSPKLSRIRRDPRISLLVPNDIDEPPSWVRFDGRAEIDHEADAQHLAVEELAPRYWDLDDPSHAEVVDRWREAPAEAFVVVRLRPDRIHAHAL